MKEALLLLLLVLTGTCRSDVQDKTRLTGSQGSEVVEAVVNMIRESCLFSDDKLFLRRLAYVETRDGTDPLTYRSGFDGGIWQIDHAKFAQTQTSNSSKSLYSAIKSAFSIDWSTVQWSDLRKPLYSGLAATLYLTSLTEQVPRVKTDQSRFYAKYFNTDPSAENKFTAGTNTFDIVCRQTNLDLAFLVDASSSLSPEDFDRAKLFAHNVVDNFKIGRDSVRVAFVTFSSGYTPEFGFNNFTNKESLQKAIDGVLKTEGRTDTDLALEYASQVLFTNKMGSREGSSKVILLITDGKSTKSFKTVPAALRARNKGIVIFAIGVGNDVDVQELEHVANLPVCTHVIQMKEYSDLDALVDEIQQVSCIAPTVLKPGKQVYPCSQSGAYQITNTGASTMVTMTVTDGMIHIYGSLSNPTPSEAGHDFYSYALSTTSSVILVDNNHKPVYFNISTNSNSFTCVGNYTINIGAIDKVKPNTFVTCVDYDVARPCSVAEVYAHLYHMVPRPYSFTNPCERGKSNVKPHPYDMRMFVLCDANYTMYEFLCPAHHVYDAAVDACIPGEPPSTTTTSATTTTKTSTRTKATTTSIKASTASTRRTTTSTKTPTTSTKAPTTHTPSTTTATTRLPTTTTTTTKLPSTASTTTSTSTVATTKSPTSSKPVTTPAPTIHIAATSSTTLPETSNKTPTSKQPKPTATPNKYATYPTYPTFTGPDYGPDGPCTDLYIQQNGGSLFFPYTKDKTKFIECTEWSNYGFIKSCPSGKVWDQKDLTCVFESVVINPTGNIFDKLPNPCNNFLSPDNAFFPHPTDTRMYIHCDQYGNAFEKTCPLHHVWNQNVLQCMPQGLRILG